MKAMVFHLGSINIDRVYSLDHIVAPGETERASNLAFFPGGKGLNQSIALARAGAAVRQIGAVGTSDGEPLRILLSENGVQIDAIQTVPGETGHAVILVDAAGMNSIIVTPGANACVTTEQIQSAISTAKPGDFFLAQNETSCLPDAIRLAHRANLRIFLNPSPITPELEVSPLELVSDFLLNETEAAFLANCPVSTDPGTILHRLLFRFPNARFVLTCGAAGAWFADALTPPLLSPSFPTDPIDTTAAGDTFAGFYIAAIADSLPPREAMRLANAAAAISITRPGASPSIPTAREVARFLASKSCSSLSSRHES